MSDQGLFRTNAVKQQVAKFDGDIIIAQPLSSSILTNALLLLVSILIPLLALSSFHRKETITSSDYGEFSAECLEVGKVADLCVTKYGLYCFG